MSDRIVRPTFGAAESRNASNAETAIMVVVAFVTAGLMIWGAVDLCRWILSLIR